MSAHFERAMLLLQQSRHALAEEELRKALAEEPDHALAHSYLGLCLANRERFKEATVEAERGVELAPDISVPFYVLATVLQMRNRLDEAEDTVDEAIRLDPEDVDNHALAAEIRYGKRRWQSALDAAEEGLRIDPENTTCNNLRAMALVKLGRKAEAGATIESALARDPDNALTHANRGWTYLEQSNPQKALEHFREALRLDPELDWARQGIVEALKAKNIFYLLMLRYFLFMAKLSGKAQWAIIVGGYIGYRVLLNVAENHPTWAPWIRPLLVIYIVFAVMTWIAPHLFNLLLRLSRFGRLVLSREQIVASNWVLIYLLIALGVLGLGVTTRDFDLFWASLGFALTTICVAGVYRCSPGWPRNVMIVLTCLLTILGFGALASLLCAGPDIPGQDMSWGRIGGWLLLIAFLFGNLFSGWIANGLMMISPKK